MTLVELHCHSNLSDGYFPPEELADRIAAAGVHYAALTDHDRVDGLFRFREQAARRGMGVVNGVEVSCIHWDREVHVLAYGFDPENPDLQKMLASIRETRKQVSGSLAQRLARRRNENNGNGVPSFREAAEVLHKAGGKIFLAHPFALDLHEKQLETRVLELRELGLDGIEAWYKPYSPEQCQKLIELAERHGLMLSAGSDYHGNEQPNPATPGIEAPVEVWKAFRDALIREQASSAHELRPVRVPEDQGGRWSRYFLRILLPSFLSIALFVWLILGYAIPQFESHLLERKREMIRELTNSAWSVLAEYVAEAERGRLTEEEAKAKALERVGGMRYGEGRKDYFWITDMQPRLLMHPYRPDLEGTDVSNFTDPNGVRLFVEFVKTVRSQGKGYVEYVWQWKDDPTRLAPKESYVTGFEPWGWVIGTGLYIEDVQQEIKSLTERVVNASFLIILIVAGLLFLVVWQTGRLEKRRRQAEAELEESHERYRTLVEAAGEGTMLVVEDRCAYANATLCKMTGYTPAAFSLLAAEDVLPEWKNTGTFLGQNIQVLTREDVSGKPLESCLRLCNGTDMEVLLGISPVQIGEQDGWIVNVKDITTHKHTERLLGETREQYRLLTDSINLGVLRVEADPKGPIIEANPAALRILGIRENAPLANVALTDFLLDSGDRETLFDRLEKRETIQNRIVRLRKLDGSLPVVSLSAVSVQSTPDKKGHYDFILEDITERKHRESERQAMMEELQTSLLFLNEPVSNVAPNLLTCPANASIREAARRMEEADRSAVAIVGDGDSVVGLVTERDMTRRSVAVDFDGNRPVCEIMTAPVIAIAESALVFEAFLLMQEKGIRHLALRNREGRITGLIQNQEMMQFHRYAAGALALEVERARTVKDLATCRHRLPLLVKNLIDCGARSRNVTRIITRISDAIVSRLVEFTLDELGPPPTAFSFLVLGSEGRGEQTLATDQDNAIVFEDTEAKDQKACQAYFLELGRRVCEGLNQAGLTFCKAESMGRNPRWCQPLSVWREYFTEWIHTDDPRDFLDINIFFDFRSVAGEESLAALLRTHIEDTLQNKAAFFHHFAQTVLLYKPPVGFFGQITTRSSGEEAHTFDIKSAMTPIVNFARIYALYHKLRETNTTDRLGHLHDLVEEGDAIFEEVSTAYDYLMQLRLATQSTDIANGKAPANSVSPRHLSALDETMVKQSFSLIAQAQRRISQDFVGHG